MSLKVKRFRSKKTGNIKWSISNEDGSVIDDGYTDEHGEAIDSSDVRGDEFEDDNVDEIDEQGDIVEGEPGTQENDEDSTDSENGETFVDDDVDDTDDNSVDDIIDDDDGVDDEQETQEDEPTTSIESFVDDEGESDVDLSIDRYGTAGSSTKNNLLAGVGSGSDVDDVDSEEALSSPEEPLEPETQEKVDDLNRTIDKDEDQAYLDAEGSLEEYAGELAYISTVGLEELDNAAKGIDRLVELRSLDPSCEHYASKIAVQSIAMNNGLEITQEDIGETIKNVIKTIFNAIRNFLKKIWSVVTKMVKWFLGLIGIYKEDKKTAENVLKELDTVMNDGIGSNIVVRSSVAKETDDVIKKLDMNIESIGRSDFIKRISEAMSSSDGAVEKMSTINFEPPARDNITAEEKREYINASKALAKARSRLIARYLAAVKGGIFSEYSILNGTSGDIGASSVSDSFYKLIDFVKDECETQSREIEHNLDLIKNNATRGKPFTLKYTDKMVDKIKTDAKPIPVSGISSRSGTRMSYRVLKYYGAGAISHAKISSFWYCAVDGTVSFDIKDQPDARKLDELIKDIYTEMGQERKANMFNIKKHRNYWNIGGLGENPFELNTARQYFDLANQVVAFYREHEKKLSSVKDISKIPIELEKQLQDLDGVEKTLLEHAMPRSNKESELAEIHVYIRASLSYFRRLYFTKLANIHLFIQNLFNTYGQAMRIFKEFTRYLEVITKSLVLMQAIESKEN